MANRNIYFPKEEYDKLAKKADKFEISLSALLRTGAWMYIKEKELEEIAPEGREQKPAEKDQVSGESDK